MYTFTLTKFLKINVDSSKQFHFFIYNFKPLQLE